MNLPAQDLQQKASPGALSGVSEAELSNANNPLADMSAVGVENINYYEYWVQQRLGITGPTADTVNSANTVALRPTLVLGRQIIRATLPVGAAVGQDGLGDLSVFDAIKLTKEDSKTDFAIGPLFVAPTATNRVLGQGKWQVGATALVIRRMRAASLLGGQITWQHSFAGNESRPDAHLMTVQPVVSMSVGGGYYVRSMAVMAFDFPSKAVTWFPSGWEAAKIISKWVMPSQTCSPSRNSRRITEVCSSRLFSC